MKKIIIIITLILFGLMNSCNKDSIDSIPCGCYTENGYEMLEYYVDIIATCKVRKYPVYYCEQ